MSKPAVLFHGSRVLVSVLEPREGPINAAHERLIAMPFALAFLPDERGRSKWSMRGTRICLDHGSLDPNGSGYLYRVPSARFEQVNQLVWVCREPVTPIDYEVIRSADYLDWIAAGAG